MIDVQLLPLESDCTHPKLASWSDIFTGAHCYQCMACGKEISIPGLTLIQGPATNEAGIVGLAFGEHWREKLQQGDYARRWVQHERV